MKKGFTLTELIITVSLVIILSMISVPIYKNYQRSAKMAEAYAFLSRIRQEQKAYYDEFGTFLHFSNATAAKTFWLTHEEVLGIDARTNKYCTMFILTENGDTNTKKYQFCSSVKLPWGKNIYEGWLLLTYNVTTGSTFTEYNR